MASIRFEPRDIWVGLFWDRRDDGTHFYLCPLPCVVIHWVRLTKASRRRREAFERGDRVVLQKMSREEIASRRRLINDLLERADQQHPSRLDRWDRWDRQAFSSETPEQPTERGEA